MFEYVLLLAIYTIEIVICLYIGIRLKPKDKEKTVKVIAIYLVTTFLALTIFNTKSTPKTEYIVYAAKEMCAFFIGFLILTYFLLIFIGVLSLLNDTQKTKQEEINQIENQQGTIAQKEKKKISN